MVSGLKCIFTLKICFRVKKLHFSDPLHKESEEKNSLLAKENVLNVVKILLKPMGLNEGYE